MTTLLQGTCPFTIDRPVMRQRWERLTFLHWPFEPADVQRLLPYFWSSMRLGARGTRVAYRSRRRWPGPLPAASRVRINVGDPIDPGEPHRAVPGALSSAPLLPCPPSPGREPVT